MYGLSKVVIQEATPVPKTVQFVSSHFVERRCILITLFSLIIHSYVIA